MNETAATGGPKEPKGRLSKLLERSKSYREAIGIVAAVVVAISGAVAWVVAHFATQAALHLVECRVTNSMTAQLLAIRMEQYATQQEALLAQIEDFAKQGSTESLKKITDIRTQIASLNKSRESAVSGVQKDLENTSKQCIQENPQATAKP